MVLRLHHCRASAVGFFCALCVSSSGNRVWFVHKSRKAAKAARKSMASRSKPSPIRNSSYDDEEEDQASQILVHHAVVACLGLVLTRNTTEVTILHLRSKDNPWPLTIPMSRLEISIGMVKQTTNRHLMVVKLSLRPWMVCKNFKSLMILCSPGERHPVVRTGDVSILEPGRTGVSDGSTDDQSEASRQVSATVECGIVFMCVIDVRVKSKGNIFVV